MSENFSNELRKKMEENADRILSMDQNTLGYHMEMCKIIFGEESKATKFLEYKIKEQGIDEIVENGPKFVSLLMHLHAECKGDIDEHFKTSNNL